MDNEIDKQEREIIESLEREEKEHKKYLASSPSGRPLLLNIKLDKKPLRNSNIFYITDNYSTMIHFLFH